MRDTGVVSEILYGTTPSRNAAGSFVDRRRCLLDEFNTATIHGFYQDHEGWSGTMVWLAQTASIPVEWLPRSGSSELDEPTDHFLCLIQDLNDGCVPYELVPCEFEEAGDNPEYGQILGLDLDPEDLLLDPEEAPSEWVVPETFLAAVEKSCGREGRWMREPDICGYMYYLDTDGNMIGASWYGRLADLSD